MKALLASLAAVLAIGLVGRAPVAPPAVAAQLKHGIAKFYSPGVMQRVARVRHMRLSTGVAGYAAVTDCSRIGTFVWASINGSPFERYQVLDCSAPRDRARHLREGLVIEVDYASAVRRGFSREGRARATVWLPGGSR